MKGQSLETPNDTQDSQVLGKSSSSPTTATGEEAPQSFVLAPTENSDCSSKGMGLLSVASAWTWCGQSSCLQRRSVEEHNSMALQLSLSLSAPTKQVPLIYNSRQAKRQTFRFHVGQEVLVTRIHPTELRGPFARTMRPRSMMRSLTGIVALIDACTKECVGRTHGQT